MTATRRAANGDGRVRVLLCDKALRIHRSYPQRSTKEVGLCVFDKASYNMILDSKIWEVPHFPVLDCVWFQPDTSPYHDVFAWDVVFLAILLQSLRGAGDEN